MLDVPHSDLLAEIEEFLATEGMSRSTFGSEALRDPNFVGDLESGRECRRGTIQKVRAFMAERREAAA